MADPWADFSYVRGYNQPNSQRSDGTLMDLGRQLMQRGSDDAMWSGIVDWQGQSGLRHAPGAVDMEEQVRNSGTGSLLDITRQRQFQMGGMKQFQLREPEHCFTGHHPNVENLQPPHRFAGLHPNVEKGRQRVVAQSVLESAVLERDLRYSPCPTNAPVNVDWELEQQRRNAEHGLWRSSVHAKTQGRAPSGLNCGVADGQHTVCDYGARVTEVVCELTNVPVPGYPLQGFHHPSNVFDIPSYEERVASNDSANEPMDCVMSELHSQAEVALAPDATSPCLKSTAFPDDNFSGVNDAFDVLSRAPCPETTAPYTWQSEFVMCETPHNMNPRSSFLLPPVPELVRGPSPSHLLREQAIEDNVAAQDLHPSPSMQPSGDLSRLPGSKFVDNCPPTEAVTVKREDPSKRETAPKAQMSKPVTNGGPRNGEKMNHSLQLTNFIIKCAEAVETKDDTAPTLLAKLEELSSPDGNFSQRVASYFSEALAYRLCKQKDPTSVQAEPTTLQYDLLEDCALSEACPYSKFVHLTANQALLEAVEGSDQVHIIDIGTMQGVQWSALLQALATTPGRKSPPKIRITGIAAPRLGANASASLLATGRRLSEFAKLLDLQLDFCSLIENLENLQPNMLQIAEGECVAVNLTQQLHQHAGDPSGQRVGQLLKLVRSLQPKVVVLVEYEAAVSSKIDYQTRILDALKHYSAVFESLDATMSRDSPDRSRIEKQILGEEIRVMFASQSSEGLVRHETFEEWSKVFESLGFNAAQPSHYSTSQARLLLWLYNENFRLVSSSRNLALGWRDRSLFTISAWNCS